MPNLDFVNTAKKQLSTNGGLDFIGAAKSGKSFKLTDESRKKLIEDNKIILRTQDGTVFGKVTHDAYKAIEGNTLDSYTPYDDEEKSIIDKFRLSTGAELKRDDGSSLGLVTQEGLKAITENNTANYTPINDEEAKTINSYIEYATQKRQTKINEYKEQAQAELDRIEKEKGELREDGSNLRRDRGKSSRTGRTGTQWEQKDTRTGKEKREGKPIPKSVGEKRLEKIDSEYANLDAQADALVATISDIDKYANVVYSEKGGLGQAQANYGQGRLSQNTAEAYNDYIVSPTDDNKLRAELYSALSEQFSINNKSALTMDDENIGAVEKTIREWVSVSFASYLPQFIDQTKASLDGAITMGLTGAVLGSVVPGVGTATGLTYGLRAGWVTGASKQMYDTTRGMVFKTLIDAGYDEATAMQAANDEAFLSSVIEGCGEILSMITLGTGKLVGKIAPKTAAKVSNNIVVKGVKEFAKKTGKAISKNAFLKTTTAVAGVAINAVGEYAEEYSQEAVSIANERRLKNKSSNSLVSETISVLRNQDEETSKRLHSAGVQGFRIGLMMGGVTRAGVTGVEHSIIAHTGKKIMDADTNDSGIVQSIIDVGLKHPQDSQSYKLATKLSQKEQISNYELGKLVDANKGETVNVGETYYDTKSQSTFKIIMRDENATVIESTSTNGEKIAKTFANQDADNLVRGNRFVLVDMEVETTGEQPTTTDTDSTSTDEASIESVPTQETVVSEDADVEQSAQTTTSSVSVGDTFVDTATGKTMTIVSRDAKTTMVESVDAKGKKSVTPFTTKRFDREVARGKFVNPNATTPVTTPTKTVAPQTTTSGVKVGDVYEVKGSDATYTVVARDAENTTVEIKTKDGVKTSVIPNELADDTFADSNSWTKVQDETDAEVSVVVDAMNETFEDGAKEAIFKSMENKGLTPDISVFAEQLIINYKEHGQIGHIAKFFTDNGAKVIAAIESTLDKTDATTTVSKTENVQDVAKETETDIAVATFDEKSGEVQFSIPDRIIESYDNDGIVTELARGYGKHFDARFEVYQDGTLVFASPNKERAKEKFKEISKRVPKEYKKVNGKYKKFNPEGNGGLAAIWAEESDTTPKSKSKGKKAEKAEETTERLFIDDRSYEDVGNRKVKAFQYEHPEVQPFYKAIANELRGDVKNTIKGERFVVGDFMAGTQQFMGTKRFTSDAIARIKDITGATYDEIDNALQRIINDEGQENIALAKKIELVIDDMLSEGYKTFDGTAIEANEEYLALKEQLRDDDGDGEMYSVSSSKENESLEIKTNLDYNGNTNYSLEDADYLKAVENGDMETAQKMVDEAAESKFPNSKVRDANGKLLTVFHGTTNEFTVFDRQFANIEGDFGKGYYFTSNEYDVDANYASEEGPDLKNKIARYADKLAWDEEYSDLSYEEREEIARQKLITSEPNTITAYLNMENPVYITPDEKGTLLDYNESYDEEYDEYGEPEGLLIDFIEALNEIASDYAYRDVDFNFLYEYAYDDGGVYASDAVGIIKRRISDELTDESGDLAVNEVIRLAFEQIGFDGIIDTSVYYKFRNMNGMDSGTTHYIVFDSNQIKSAEPVTYDNYGNVIPLSERFNEQDNDIRYSVEDYAPTFYSHMGKVIDEIKQDKIGANSVINYLKGKGVKNEEIKWSGIETFLEGKKSVTKAELQEFVAGSQLQIEEVTRDYNEIPYTQEQTEQIAEYESQRNEIFEELKREWKKDIGTDLPITHFNYNLEDKVFDSLIKINTQIKESTDVGKEMVEAREQLRELIAKDDFGYDSANEAYYYATRDPQDFLDNYDFTDEERAIFERFISAQENWKNAEGIPIETQKHLKNIAAKADDIRRKISRINDEHYNEVEKHKPKWDSYKLDGGENYREVIFKLPNSEYSNFMMQTHWGEDAQGILAHARIQDFEVNGKKMLFIEEIQSDWHNEGHKEGYLDKSLAVTMKNTSVKHEDGVYRLYRGTREMYENVTDAFLKNRFPNGITEEEIHQGLVDEHNRLLENTVPDAPFRDNYHEYVLKSLIRMAAEQGYDSIGWTPADVQSERWSGEFAEGYRIEYDQDIPKFLNKYGKKWGTRVGKKYLSGESGDVLYTDNNGNEYGSIKEWYQSVMDDYASTDKDIWNDYIAGKYKIIQVDDTMHIQHKTDGNILEESLKIEYGPVVVWSMPITDAMKDSVLYEGQPLYSVESEANNNEQRRNDLLPGNSRRGNDASTRKWSERISSFKQKNKGKNATERQRFAKELLKQGKAEEVIDGNNKYTLVNPEAYNDDMLAMVEEAKAKGIELGFFLGEAKIKFDTKDEFKVNGIKKSGSKLLVRYDGKVTPQKLLKHETIHAKWRTKAMQSIKNTILNSLSEDEKNAILSQDRYAYYKKVYKGNMDKVWQEFVADVMADMNNYTAKHIDTVSDYWYGNESAEGYNVATYAASIDAGGGHNAYIGENDSTGEISGRNVEKEGLFSRSNKRGTVVASEVSAERQRTDKSFDSRKNDNQKRIVTKGEIIKSVYHGSKYRFKTYEKSYTDIGIHFGTKEQAIRRVGTEDAIINKHDLILKNPLRCDDIFGERTAQEYVSELINHSSLTEQEKAKLKYEYDAYVKSNQIIKDTQESLENKLASEKYRIEATVSNDGIFVRICLMDDDGKVNEIPMAELLERDLLMEVFGPNETMMLIKSKRFSPLAKANLAPFITELAKNIELNFLKLRKIEEILQSFGYDGFAYQNENEGEGWSYAVFDDSQIIRSDDVTDTRFSLADDGILDLEDLWNGAVEKYGKIPKGEKPARDIDVPRKISEEDVVSQFARTVLEAGVTPDWAVSELETAILNGELTHEVIPNQKAHGKAIANIKKLGFDGAMRKWDDIMKSEGSVNEVDFAMGLELYNQCVTNKDSRNAMKLVADLCAEATRSARNLQLVRLLKKMTPDGQLYYLEKSIQRMNEEFKDKLGNKFKDIELDDGLMEEFLNETDEAKRDEIYDKICQQIADQIPTTLKDKWDSWRYLAMLGNPRTHIRNLTGNAVFVPAIRMKDFIAATIESGLEKAGKMDASERTKSFKKSEEAKAFAKKDSNLKEVEKLLQGINAKYAITGDIEGKRTIFKNKLLELARTKNFDFLEDVDMKFLKFHYANALSRLITVRNLDVNSLDAKTLDKIRQIAVKEAQRATFRDANYMAEALSATIGKLKKSGKWGNKAFGYVLEGIQPFIKTPMNIAKQGVYYSPAGLVVGAYNAYQMKKGADITITDVVDDFAKGLTGTLGLAVGYILSSLGILKGGDDEDKKKQAFDEMVGEQSYSLNIGDWSYTIDWMIPSSIAFFVGNELYNLTRDEFSAADVLNAMSKLTDPLLELSVFSGYNKAIKAANYSDINPIISVMVDAFASYLTQGLPTIGGQMSRLIDKNKREYYYMDKTSDMPVMFQRLIGQASSKIPFISYLYAPSVDEWGRDEEYGGLMERAIENTVSPGYYSKENYTEIDKEIQRLYESVGDSSVLPTTQQKYLSEDNLTRYLTADEYTEVKKIRGQKSFELISELMADEKTYRVQDDETDKYKKLKYSQMSDRQKVKVISEFYKDAGEYAKAKYYVKVYEEAVKSGDSSKQKKLDEWNKVIKKYEPK